MKIKQLKELKWGENITKESHISNNKVNSSLHQYQSEKFLAKIFIKKAKRDIKVISFERSGELLGLLRHFPPAAQEWVNSVYSYNSNYNKLLTIADNNLISLVKSYVNMRYKRKQRKNKLKKALNLKIRLSKYRNRKIGRSRSLRKRLSVNKIFVAKGNVKHTSKSAIITLFFYKKAVNALLNDNLYRMYLLIFKSKLARKFESQVWEKDMKYKIRKQHRRIHFKYKFYIEVFKVLEKENIISSDELKILFIKLYLKPRFNQKFWHKKNIFMLNPLEYYKKKGSVEALMDLNAKKFQKWLFKYNRFYKSIKLNEKKFQKNFLENFRKIACKIYNKNVIFNFVLLNKFYLNSNIYTQIIALKLKKRENTVNSVLGMSLNSVKLPRLPVKYKKKIIKKKVARDILYNNNYIFDLLSAKKLKVARKFWFELLLFKYNRVVNPFSLFGRMKLAHRKKQITRANKKWLAKKQITRLLNYFKTKVKSSIKNKILTGVRVEANGRLTKRFKASRSVYKLKWIGGLRNIDSSYRGLSAVMLRGHDLSNVEYTVLNTKRRIGAFGVKGWVSSL